MGSTVIQTFFLLINKPETYAVKSEGFDFVGSGRVDHHDHINLPISGKSKTL
jgi:hypothetical protein